MDVPVKYINLTDYIHPLTKIWKESFPEDTDFALPFLENAAPYIECAAAFAEKTPVSAAYFLPAKLKINGKTWDARYVYGVGTLPTYRGKGYAAQLLKTAAKQTTADVFFLYPAASSLRTFYQKLGYRDFFTQNKGVSTLVSSEKIKVSSVTPFNAAQYCVERKRFLADKPFSHAVFSADLLQILLQHFSQITFDNGTALFLETENNMYLPEILCDKENADKLLYTLGEKYPSKTIVASFPDEQVPSGMLLTVSDAAKKALKFTEKVPFFGTVFDI